ncbi:MAG: nucleotidyltransferase family protein [Pseudomonadota bacterium]
MTAGVIVVLGAGSASRMRGADKLLEPVTGKPLLRLLTERALSTGYDVLVTLPPDARRMPRAAALAELTGIRVVEVPDAATGMSASFRAAAKQLTAATEWAMFLPGDMPEITAGDLTAVARAIAQDGATIARAASDTGRPGHPVAFARVHFPALALLKGDEGARSVVAAHLEETRLVPLPGNHAVTDLDTPEDWAAWRSAQ